MNMHPSLTPQRIYEAVERYQRGLENPGFCVACGSEVDGIEPDAEKYTCEACEEDTVYGAQELLFHLPPEI